MAAKPASPPPARTARYADDSSESLVEWFTLHGRKLVLVAIAALVIAAGVWFYRSSVATTRQSAESALYSAQGALASGNVQLAQTDLAGVIARFSGTPAATQAGLLLAQTHYDMQDWDAGLRVLHDVQGSADPAFTSAVQTLIAVGLEGHGDFAGAAQAHRSAANAAQFETGRQTSLVAAAHAFAAAGDTAAAIAIWTELAADPESQHASEARVRLGELEAQAAGAQG